MKEKKEKSYKSYIRAIMGRKEGKPSIFSRAIGLLKSKTARGIILVSILCLAVLGMFMLDKGNYIRRDYLPFLQSNFIKTCMEIFNISQFNILVNSWLLFLVFCLLTIVMTLGNMFSHNVIDKSAHKIKTGVIYYFTLFILCAVIVFVAYMLGVFDTFNDETAGLFLNLLYSLIICAGFILVIPLTLIFIYYLPRLLLVLLVLLLKAIKEMFIFVFGKKKVRKPRHRAKKGEPASPEIAPEKVFPTLVNIDKNHPENLEIIEHITLEEFCLQFQAYASVHHKIYYELPLIRSFIAGLATSRLIILEGLSGTGKSMLPRMFARFTNSNAFFSPVQATWRDKTDVLGFYSEFSKTFKATPFLESLYASAYSNKTNLMVLDEMNLSRIEYYFADFLSVMEYPPEDWKIRIYDPQTNQILPKKLEGGCISVPTNTYFIGTANTDDSTFTIADKVYDRAIVLDFDEKFRPIETTCKSDSIRITADDLQLLFDKAIKDELNRLNEEDLEKFFKICDLMKEAFDVRFGNRIMVQIENFVPVYVALGGTKEEALDFMFSHKILRKVEGRYEDFIKDELANLSKLINTLYGKNVFTRTEAKIAKLTKRLV